MVEKKPASLHLVASAPASDAELCQAFLAGDGEAFAALVRRHQEPVYRVARRFAASSDDALDVTQRAFLQAFEAARRALPALLRQGREVPLRAWLLRIAVNLGKNARRDARRWARAPLVALDAHADAAPSAPEALERAQAAARVRAAVVALPRRQRECFALRVDAGLSFAEVAQTLGISEGGARAHFHGAVQALRRAAKEGEP